MLNLFAQEIFTRHPRLYSTPRANLKAHRSAEIIRLFNLEYTTPWRVLYLEFNVATIEMIGNYAGETHGDTDGYHTSNDFFEARLFHAFLDRKSTRLNSSHVRISYAVFCLKKKKKKK